MMKRTRLGLSVLLLLVFLHAPARATDGTCIVPRAISSNNLNLPFNITSAVGLAMPVSFDEAAGTFSMSRDVWSTNYGAGGASFNTVGGVLGFLIMNAGTTTGTIDAGGNIILPDFPIAFATDFCKPRSPDYPLSPALSTGTQFLEVTGQTFAVTGVALNFSTGSLTIEGQDVIPSACGAPGALLSGVRLTCTLTPIPNQAALPPAAPLAATTGKAAVGKPLPTEPANKPAKAGVLTLKTKLEGWPSPLDVAGNDVHVSVAVGDETVVLLHVPAGKFITKGKKSTVKDKDGTSIVVVMGHASNDTVSAAFGGVITFVSGRRGVTLKLKVLGLDLTGLTGATTVTVAVGSRSATAGVTTNGTGKVRKVK
jgi:hypothetical protein